MAEIMEEKKELTPAETAAPASPETPAKKGRKKHGRQEKAAAYDPADRCAGGRGRPDRRRREILQKEGRQQRGRHGDGVLRRYQLLRWTAAVW